MTGRALARLEEEADALLWQHHRHTRRHEAVRACVYLSMGLRVRGARWRGVLRHW